jgi:hypothetical protein
MDKTSTTPVSTGKKKRGITLKRAGDARRALTAVYNEHVNGEIDSETARTRVYILQALMKAIEQTAVEDALQEVREGNA